MVSVCFIWCQKECQYSCQYGVSMKSPGKSVASVEFSSVWLSIASVWCQFGVSVAL
jgi:hypothetical protein